MSIFQRYFNERFPQTQDRIKNAVEDRKAFVNDFPIQSIRNLPIEKYVFTPKNFGEVQTFCTRLKLDLKDVSSMGQSFDSCFWIYISEGRLKMYKSLQNRFGDDFQGAYKYTIEQIEDLLRAGLRGDSDAIAKNELHSSFKCKLLSVYFPDRYFPVVAKSMLENYCRVIGVQYYAGRDPIYSIDGLMKWKKDHTEMDTWDLVQYMDFCGWLIDLDTTFDKLAAKTNTQKEQTIQKETHGVWSAFSSNLIYRSTDGLLEANRSTEFPGEFLSFLAKEKGEYVQCIQVTSPVGEFELSVVNRNGNFSLTWPQKLHDHFTNVICSSEYYPLLMLNKQEDGEFSIWLQQQVSGVKVHFTGNNIENPKMKTEPRPVWRVNTAVFNEAVRKLMSIMIEKQAAEQYQVTELSFDRGILHEQEGFKKTVIEQSKGLINPELWNEQDIGTGDIGAEVLAALNIKTEDGKQNLVDWRDVEALGEVIKNKTELVERAFYLIFKSPGEEAGFNATIQAIGERFPIISFLYFIKDSTKYAPMRPAKFQSAFERLGIETVCCKRCSWENYSEFTEILQWIKLQLNEDYHIDAELIDAHSFVWMTWMLDAQNEIVISPECEQVLDSKEDETTVLSGSSEGRKVEYYTTKYERDAGNRSAALEIHGYTCMACGFNFEKVYGSLGKNFIEVHHVKPLYSLDQEMIINPETDLISLCPNCHRMIHRKKNGIMTLEELKTIISQNA